LVGVGLGVFVGVGVLVGAGVLHENWSALETGEKLPQLVHVA